MFYRVRQVMWEMGGLSRPLVDTLRAYPRFQFPLLKSKKKGWELVIESGYVNSFRDHLQREAQAAISVGEYLEDMPHGTRWAAHRASFLFYQKHGYRPLKRRGVNVYGPSDYHLLQEVMLGE